MNAGTWTPEPTGRPQPRVLCARLLHPNHLCPGPLDLHHWAWAAPFPGLPGGSPGSEDEVQGRPEVGGEGRRWRPNSERHLLPESRRGDLGGWFHLAEPASPPLRGGRNSISQRGAASVSRAQHSDQRQPTHMLARSRIVST